MYRRIILGIVLVIGISGLAGSATITVNSDGSGDYATIQEALTAAAGGDEIIVGAGTYSGVGNRDLDFEGKALILRSADDAVCVIDCEQQGRAFIFENDEGVDSVVDGFTIINGYHVDYGGAIECVGASPTIRNCTITDCSSYDGGAIDCYNASPTIADCVLSGNYAINDGGAIECYSGSAPNISGCTITGNIAGHSGGGIDCYSSSPVIVNCRITGNEAVSDGGGIECYTGSLSIITNCRITGNSAGRYGGAVDCYDSSPVISYCTIEGNIADVDSGGVGGIYADALSVLTQITSCIIWNNGDDLFGCAARYSCIEDGDIGEGNISPVEGPLFRRGNLGDYYLSSRLAGQQADSECIDRGDPNLVMGEFDPAFYTTSTDSELDAGLPDMGYHYRVSDAPEEFELTIGVVPDPANPHGVLEVVDFIVGTHPTYRKYSEVRLRATPDIDADGYKVKAWYGLRPEDTTIVMNEQIITILEDRDVSVEFMPFPMFTLTTEVLDTGDGIHGTVAAIGGAPTGEPGQTWQYANDMVIVEAVPDPGYQVRYWMGTDDDETATGSTFAYATMLSDRTVVVEFVPDDMAHLVTQVIDGHGSVTPKRADVAVGTIVPLMAIPDEGYRVLQWTGTMYDWSTEPNNYVEMTWSKTVTVEFEEIPRYKLFTNVYAADGVIHGTIYPNSGEWWNDGEVVPLYAMPDPDYEVVRWYGTDDDVSTDANNLVTINGGDAFVYVEFREQGLPDGTIIIARDPNTVYDTIQEAIDAAEDGDEVIVARGTYTGEGNRDLDLMGGLGAGRAIIVRSEFGPQDCIIDCEGTADDPHRGFVFNGPENILHWVIGFTITNGYADQGGALYYAPGAMPFVGGCILENNHATEGGGAVWFEGPGEESPDDDGGGDTPADFIPPNFDLDGDGTNDSWDLNDDGIIDATNDATDTDGDGIPDVGNVEGARIPDGGDDDDEEEPHAFLFGCDILNNTSDGHGGGIYITNWATPWIVFTEISGNHAGSYATPPAFGGGVYSDAESVPEIINCLFTLNVSTDIGGAIYLRDSDAIIRMCTIMYNEGLDYGDYDGNTPIGSKGGIAARDSEPEINHCIIGRSGYAMLGYGTWGDDYSWGDDLFGCEATYSCIENGDDGDNNIRGNPRFIAGGLGDFYLSQRPGQSQNSPCVNAGEADILETFQDAYFLPPYMMTTSILNQYDIGNGDLGYHYPIFDGPPIQYKLTMYVHGHGHMSYADYGLGDLYGYVYPGSGLPGDPNTVVIYLSPGDMIYFNAYADEGNRVFQWSGTDDDSTFANYNTVTMYGDQEVHLYFEKSYIRTLNIPGDYTYTQVQMAIDDARDGDTIVLHSGTYQGVGFEITGKDITITSAFPNDPDYVAATIFDFSTIRGTGLYIGGSGVGTCVLNGITIANARSGEDQSPDPDDDPGLRGIDGMGRCGQGLTVDGDHIIANLVIRDCEIYGEDASGGNGGSTDDGLNGGNGGNGGAAGGAGLYVGSDRYRYTYYGDEYGYYYISSGSPVIMNCTITNCYAEAGDGANGGNGPEGVRAGEGGVPGRVFGAGVFCDVGTSPTFIDCVITDNLAVGGLGGDGGDETHIGSLRPGWGGLTDEFVPYYYDDPDDPTVYSAGDPRQYTANGAGVYVGGMGYGYDYSYYYYNPYIDFGDIIIIEDPYDPYEPYVPQYPLTDATFINCTIARNITQGSISGRGGQFNSSAYLPPMHHYQIPSFGAGFYCAEDANTLLIDCRIVDNETQANPRGDGFDDYFSPDHYIGYGGGVAVQGSDDINPHARIKTSHIARNFAPVGGGMHWFDSQLDIADSNVVENVAYVGGGMHFFDSIDSIIARSVIQDNIAAFGVEVGTDPNAAGQADSASIYGAGGGVFGYTSDIIIRDTKIMRNASTSSGGGVYLGGHPEGLYPLLGIPALENCLIVNNNANNDGGGVSVNWYAEPIITNCTIADNVVTNSDGLGGGLFCGYDSNTIVINSIIWDNFGAVGSQIAVTGGGEYRSFPSELDITHSAVFDYQDTEGSGFEDPSDEAIREDFSFFNLPANNDGSTGLVDLGFEISFYDTEYTSLYINNNGNVSFAAPWPGFNPVDLISLIGTPIIAPFFADVDTTGPQSDVVTYAYRTGMVNGHNAFAVNWINVGYANGNSDLVNRFQLVLIDRSDRDPGDFDIEFNYDRIEWETGDNDGGVGGLGGNSARAGFSSGTGAPGTYYEFDGSGVNGTFLDSNLQSGLIHNRSNSKVPGRYVFSVINGRPVMPGFAIFVEEASVVHGWDAQGHLWADSTNNIQDDPAFVTGYYYLREDSDCIDAGAPNAVDVGLDQYTTRSDGTPDANEVDLGYHYRQGAPQYELIIEIAENAEDPGIHGSVEKPEGDWFMAGSELILRAVPLSDYYLDGWYDSRDVLVSTSEEFEIVIDEDNYFRVVFKVARTLEVSDSGGTDPGALAREVSAARNGDTVIVWPGTYTGDINPEGKKLTIVSVNPDDPDVVAATVIDCGSSQQAFTFDNEDTDVVIRGFMIINGAAANGGAIYIGTKAAPFIKNIHISNCTAAGNGGAIYIASEASPTLTDVIIDNCSSAGNGGAVYVGPVSSPVFTDCIFTNCSAGSGSGGAVYCSISSTPEFTDCIFTNNTAGLSGGAMYCNISCNAAMTNCRFISNSVSGVGSIDEDPIYGGGAIFYEYENEVEVADCNFVDNSAQFGGAVFFNRWSTGTFEHSWLLNNNAATDGGAIYTNWTDGLEITDCAIVENTAMRGGGLYSIGSTGNVISSCSFRDNLADSSLVGPTDPNVVGPVVGQSGNISGFGGGIFLFAEDGLIIEDSAFSMNMAGNIGGGLYIAGNTQTGIPAVSPELFNCLITTNTAGRAGGGVACDWFVEPVISNCTIADNGTTNYGGGLYVSYDSKVTVIDSIIWANYAIDGSQIAVINDDEFDAGATSLDISYSDVGPVSDANELVIDPEAGLVVTPITDSFGLTDVLLGEGIEIIGSPSYNGASAAAGTFTGGLTAGIGIESGIILTNGGAELAEAPNISDSTSQTNNYPGDMDLDALVGGFFFFNFTYDATVLEFDFETRGGNVFFNYVFASEEYNEFANFFFFSNDVFAFFLDGVNIALIPGTNTAVSINSINGGNPYGFFANNPELYNNNDLDDGGPFFEIEYDGFTNVLTARAMDIGPGVHHIKLAIADVGFSSYDSAVFIEAGSLSDGATFGLPVYVEDNCTLNDEVRFDFDPFAHRWDPNDFILGDDPRFVGDDWLYGGDDPLLFVGGYMLSHIDAGQPVDSNCIDFGHILAEDSGLDGYTTRTDLETDADMVDLGYHYALFERALYELIVEIDEGSSDGPHGTVVITPSPDPDTDEIEAGTMVTVTAIPDAGYRVREWIGIEDSPAWQETSTTLLMNADITIGVVFEVDVKRTLLVPQVYATIEEAVAVASQGDDIVLSPEVVHYISDPDGIDFEGKNLTVMSPDPDDPVIIAETVIDCQGSRFVAKRAFHFQNGEDNRSKLWGITIRNGYKFPIRGGDGVVTPTAMWPGAIPPNYQGPDPPPVMRALYGEDASGNGYGGAILCENESSPTFENCVFYNNIVTGAQGGDGANGWPLINPPYNDPGDAQPGGHAGDGQGNGYGGAVSCWQRSNPVIINCTFEDNMARGGMGGEGGNAGPADGGHENCGGDGGWAIGFGQGGAVYFDRGCLPIITGCTFINNTALDGRPGNGGSMTSGTEWGDGWIAHPGLNGITITYERVWGGALYYASNSVADITASLFVGNKAFESYRMISDYVYATEPIIIPSYISTRGGAIFSDPGNAITLKDCDFVENRPGAVYAHSRSWVDVDNCTFVDNSNPGDDMLDAFSPYDVYGLYFGFDSSFLFGDILFLGTIYSEIPAGALYLGPESHQIDITDSDFRGNYIYANGGAVICKSDASFTGCLFGGNTANGYGGAFYGYEGLDPNKITISLDFQNCSFMDNEATYGGGLYLRECDSTFNSCYFMTNEADNGGGLFLAEGSVALDGGIMRGNRASSDYALGGAMACASTGATIENFVIEDNVVDGGEVYGGGIMFYGADTLITQTVKNCLFTGNSSSYGGGAIGCNIFVEAVMENCTFADNDAGLFGGALFCDWSSHPKINNSIFTGNGHHAVYEEQIGGDSQVTFSLFNDNADGDIYDAGTGASYTGPAAINTVNDNHDNIDGIPLFEVGPLGDYYLAIASPAVDKGSAPSVDLGFDLKTTRTDNVHDDDIVDLGYHYDDIATLQPFQLTVSVISGEGSVTPTSGTYYRGQAVTVTAIPDADYIVKTWGGGTLNDNSRETTNVVIMDADKQITVEFAQPRLLVVGSEGQYTSIQRAIDDAEDGDIVQIQTGEWVPPYAFSFLSFWGKDITLAGVNPDDEDTVANTLMSGYDFVFNDVGPRTIIEGLTISVSRMYLYSSSPTIRNCNFIDSHWVGMDGIDGPAIPLDIDGTDGVSVLGGAIEMYDSSPEISNCRFANCSVTGGNGGRGDDATPGHPDGWDGGWAGRAYGGAVYAAWNSNPVFTDCVFDNCFARGGNGGDGGNSVPLAYGGRGGNWVWAPSIEESTYWWWWDGWMIAPILNGDKFGDYGWFYWSGWIDTNADWYQDYLSDPLDWADPYDRYYDYWKYTGLGGAFYCEVNCSPVFTGCTFTNNNTYGGDSGVGGTSFFVSGPTRPMDIETAGGAIYIGDGCSPLLQDCLIRNNTADTTTVVESIPGLAVLDGPDDYYVSFGGGVAVEDNASPKFVNCDIQYNHACEGGGMYWSNSEATIVDCNFVANTAYHGAGMYSTNSTGEITGTFLTRNFASVVPSGGEGIAEPNDVGAPGATFTHSVFGRGGGYYSLSSLVNISDSVIKENSALASGGGIFYVGSDQDNAVVPTLTNSLITQNTAGRDGGGVSINWSAEPEITNCTISDNMVTGALGIGFGYGGGIYVGYNAGAYISDSIIWGNAGATGAQIAVTNGDPRPSEVTIVYSDIGPPYDPNAFDTLLLLADEGQEEGDTGTTSFEDSTSVLVDAQTIYDGFDAGAETVRVIILLRDFTDMRNATDWDSAVSTALLRDAIADRQSMVLSTLTSAEFTVKYQYENIAGFAGDVSLDGLIKLLENPMVEHIEPDREVFPMLAQSIPLANALAARQAYDGRGISIAIVDTGIDYNHERLGAGGFPNAKVIGGYDTAMNDPDPVPFDNAHGTACAGIAAGDLGTIGDYIGGVAYGARLYSLKMMTDGGIMPLAAGIAAWDWCVTNKNNDPQNPIMVISNSWGIPGLPFTNSAAADAFTPALTAAANTATQAGMTILAASGNDGFAGIGISHPSAMSNVISVGAVYDTTDMVTPYSNTGDLLDILAPADPMYTTDMVGIAGYDPGDYYPYFNGTSSACPFAAGCVASIQAAALDKTDRYLTPGEIRNLLIATGVPITDTKVAITKPRVNLGAAIANLTSLPIYVDEGCILHGWDPNDQEWDPNTFNVMEDPLLVGDYFLSEVAAGQLYDSICVDYIYNVEQGRMATDFFDFDLYEYTTRSDAKPDDGALNVGYHHRPFEIKRHKLYFVAIIDPFDLPTYDPVVTPDIPDGKMYNYATQVELSVNPPPPSGFHAVWNGTDDDTINDPENVVTMDDDRMVTVSFESIGYTLDAEVIVDANVLPYFPAVITLPDLSGGFYPPDTEVSAVYYPGTEVTMTVTEPPEGFQVKWTGVDDRTIVSATNVVTMTSDRRVTAEYVEEGTEYYAVIVGISDYYDLFFPFIELPYASRDAYELAAKLAQGVDWDEDNIYTLTDSQATKGAIRLALQQLSEELDSDDVLVFYFSGYGFAGVDVDPIDEIDGQDEHLITYAYSTIRDDELGQMLAEFATDNYVVLIESDFSAGQIDGINSSSIGTYDLSESVQLQFTNSIASENGMSFAGDEDVDPLPQDLNRNEAGVVLAACGVDELAFYSADFRHGVFTYYLLRAIEGAADWFSEREGALSGYVSAEEAYEYLAPKVDSYISDMVVIGNLPLGTTQRPRIYDADPVDDGESDIDILDVGAPDAEPTTWYVPGDADRIQDAVDIAKDGDVIVLTAGTYKGGSIIIDKSVTITSTNPDDPDVVAGTVIDLSDTISRFAVYFTSNTGSGSVLNGITITANGWIRTIMGSTDGFDGGDVFSTGLIIGSGASPRIQNCVISGFEIHAGRGGDGDEDDTNFFNGDGGDGGNAYGGGVYCLAESSPTFINTTIIDCHVFGGDGGNGAEVNEFNFGGGRGGWGGWARGGGVFVGDLSAPLFINCTISDCTATGGNGGNGGNGGEVDDLPYPPGYGGSWSDIFYYPWQLLGQEGDYTLYSAYGGGVYCSSESKPRFIDCTISGNTTQGGVSGLGGEVGDGALAGGMTISGGRIYPFEIFEIPSFGGGVYCAPDSIVEFEGCEISTNIAPKPGTVLVIDPALGYGGGVAIDEAEDAKFTDCLISGNESSIGGGVYWYGNTLLVEDCNIMDNLAYNGGGIYGIRGDAVIEGGYVHGNFAGAAATDPEQVVGRGGGIHLASVTAHIGDLELLNNQASASGGGLYLTGTEPNTVTITNCLLDNNMAGREGGGVSSNWFAQPRLSNCTFANNWATGYFGFIDSADPNGGPGLDPNGIPQGGSVPEEVDFESVGGGLFCGYESRAVVIDSIFKGNYAANGRQLAVGTGFEFDLRPGTLTVSYSNIQGGQGEPATLVEEDCELNWSDNILVDPMFVVGPLGNFYLSQIVAGQPAPDSPCVDTGSDYASETGMDKYTTRSDDMFETYDVGVVDMGYHYPLKLTMAACKACDLVFDGIVDIQDLYILAGEWLNACTDPDWCDGADINTDEGVNFTDFVIFAFCWFVDDREAPIPNPSEWVIEPRSLGAGSDEVEMSAKVSVDAWWSNQVEYYFDCLTDPAHSSGWRQNYDPSSTATYVANPEYYEDTGLVADGETEYTYRVMVRDGRDNRTAWSVERTAIPGHEFDPPLPDPAMWYGDDVTGPAGVPDGILDVDLNADGIPDGMPYAISGTALRMLAHIGTDMSPFDDGSLEYYFRYTDAAGEFDGIGDGYDSEWQQSHDPVAPYYTPTPHIFEPDGLTPLANYYYRIRVRDKFGNVTDESVVALGVPDTAVIDFNPPLPDPPLWENPPQQFTWVNPDTQLTEYWHWMSVQAVADPEGNGEEYYFECLDGAPDSGWLNVLNLSLDPTGLPAAGPNEYYVRVSAPNSQFRYRVRTRDQSPNQNTGGWSEVLTVPADLP